MGNAQSVTNNSQTTPYTGLGTDPTDDLILDGHQLNTTVNDNTIDQEVAKLVALSDQEFEKAIPSYLDSVTKSSDKTLLTKLIYKIAQKQDYRILPYIKNSGQLNSIIYGSDQTIIKQTLDKMSQDQRIKLFDGISTDDLFLANFPLAKEYLEDLPLHVKIWLQNKQFTNEIIEDFYKLLKSEEIKAIALLFKLLDKDCVEFITHILTGIENTKKEALFESVLLNATDENKDRVQKNIKKIKNPFSFKIA